MSFVSLKKKYFRLQIVSREITSCHLINELSIIFKLIHLEKISIMSFSNCNIETVTMYLFEIILFSNN